MKKCLIKHLRIRNDNILDSNGTMNLVYHEIFFKRIQRGITVMRIITYLLGIMIYSGRGRILRTNHGKGENV